MGNNLLSAKATLPVYDRNNLAPRILAHGAKATVAKYSVK
jgi:fructuronate reductase